MYTSTRLLIGTWVYAFGGIIIAAINFPVFIIIYRRKALRQMYTIVAFAVLSSGFTGVSMSVAGFSRFRFYVNDDANHLIPNKRCLLNIAALLLLCFNLLNGFGLLLNSVDRLSAIVFPIFYYRKRDRFTTGLLISIWAMSFIFVLVAVIITLMRHITYVPAYCGQQDLLYKPFYEAITILRTLLGALSVILLIIVFIVMTRKQRTMANSSMHGTDFSTFMENQKSLTNTIFISCTLTLLLFVIPSIYQIIVMFTSSEKFSEAVSPFTIVPSLFNSVNEALVLFVRQGDVHTAAIRILKRMVPKCCRKKAVSTVKSFSDNSAITFPSIAMKY